MQGYGVRRIGDFGREFIEQMMMRHHQRRQAGVLQEVQVLVELLLEGVQLHEHGAQVGVLGGSARGPQVHDDAGEPQAEQLGAHGGPPREVGLPHQEAVDEGQDGGAVGRRRGAAPELHQERLEPAQATTRLLQGTGIPLGTP